jgi:D-threo-aldose 1-dehydrogenase
VRTIELPLCDLKVSRFIFGTASLFNVNVARPKERQNLLAAAVDAGFTHFDTAPSYGFGLAERDLAPILKAYPHVSFTTKVGIYSPGGENQGNISVFLRKASGRIIPAISRFTIDFSLSRAKDALEGSLKRSSRDTIDLYTLHEPELQLLQVDEWQRWLEDCKSSGKVRHFGLALTADQLAPFLQHDVMIGNIIQLIDSLEDREADLLAKYGKPMQITYGYVTAAFRYESPLSVPEILRQSLQRNRDGAVIVSSTKISRLPQYAKIVEEVDHAV